MASDHQPCHFLELPRELRNAIYEELAQDRMVCITQDLKDKNTVYLCNAPIASVMRLCKQTHDEYNDVRFKKASLVIYAEQLDLKSSSFTLKSGVPLHLFRHIEWCQISVPYGLFTDVDDEKINTFLDEVAGGLSYEEALDREWTPSKHAIAELSKMLTQLSKWLPKVEAEVGIDIIFNNTPEDLELWTDDYLIQSPTFIELRQDANTPFARDGKLEVRFSIGMPLCSVITAWDTNMHFFDSGPSSESDAHPYSYPHPDETSARLTTDGIEYHTKPSKEIARWLLLPACRHHAQEGWCGFMPQFAGVVRRCPHH